MKTPALLLTCLLILAAWSAPASNGGSELLGYTATSSPGSKTAIGPSSPITRTGLTNGTSYTVTVFAANSVDRGLASAPSDSVTPATVPDAPAIGIATGGDAQASVTFTQPAFDGGSAITSYTVIYSGGTATGTSSPITVTGLTNGTSYTFTVTATNSAGTGPASAPSNSVTPVSVPGAPTNVSATAGDAQASVAFTAPASNGTPITLYTVTSSGGQTATGASSPITVTGLTNGTSYTFTVMATNALGAGPTETSNSVVPATVPGPPANVSATGGNALATAIFAALASNGGLFVDTASGIFYSIHSEGLQVRYEKGAAPLFGVKGFYEASLAAWDGPNSDEAIGVARGFQWGRVQNTYASAAVGLSLLGRETANLGTPLELYIRVAYGKKFRKYDFSVGWIHYSNAQFIFGWNGPNLSENFLTLSLGRMF